ncbi:EcoKI restriction-modification system protein HsdS [Bremerella volcania]|uniref:EcoKI restriction-modification system protein HsdS n=1 Tax=Bremerella volcania TaxID=2527984 RepID=A0A518CCI8_9BACT|nr:restriction endonuclease subunit S [Bremerella volcania]QDU76931.1 EcoKI restriction-modification system protein HsdS [Bremerella volcania]
MTTSNGWPLVALSEIVTPVQRSVSVVPGETYRTLGVKWWGEGAYERQTIDGSETAVKTLNEVREDDLIINKIWVRHGSVAVVPAEVAGCVGSNEFPTFECRRDCVLPRWLHWYSKARELWQKCDALSQGSSGKNRIRPEKFLTIEVPLPTPAQQETIVAQIDRIADKIGEAKSLRTSANKECDQLCRAILRDEQFGPPTLTPMHELVTWRKPDVDVVPTKTYHFAGVYCFGRGVFRGQVKAGNDFAYKRLTQIREGEFVYPKLMAWEGALAVVPNTCDGLFVSPEFPVFTINEDRVFPEVLDVYFRSPSVWPLLSGASTGTNVRRKRLNPKDFLNYELPLPSNEAQVKLRNVRRKMSELQSLHDQSAQLDALLPSILDRAFRGEL